MRIPGLCLLVLAALAPAAAAEDLAAAHQAVRDADLGMAKAVAAGDADGFRAWLDDGAVFLGGASILNGPDQIAAGWKRFLDPEDPLSLAWEPTRVWLAASGELAATTGDYTLHYPGADGALATQTGRAGVREGRGTVLTLWIQGNGGWIAAAEAATPLRPAD
jgi:ketosteroid isomerase-like protein